MRTVFAVLTLSDGGAYTRMALPFSADFRSHQGEVMCSVRVIPVIFWR